MSKPSPHLRIVAVDTDGGVLLNTLVNPRAIPADCGTPSIRTFTPMP